ncbi:MAG: molecular chaperone [Mycobacterium leprae]
MTTLQLNPVSPAHAVLYRFLTEGFCLPDANRLEYLADRMSILQAACEELMETEHGPESAPDIPALERAIADARSNALGELQAEYTRLFVAGMPNTPARLVEAVQREGVLVGEATEDVASMYLRFGLAVQDRETDHLTAELEFLTYLAGTPVAEGLESARYSRARLKFVREHLSQWTPKLAFKIRNATKVPLYLALADLLEWVVDAEIPLKG